jgi:predicted transposase/invertase (TIGR01784 family)|nr:hypothetical protein [Pelodictyon phaeoclathratiforme]
MKLAVHLIAGRPFFMTAHQLDREHTPKELAIDKNIVKAITAIDRMFDEEERQVYEVRKQSLVEAESKIASALEKGMEKGREEGVNAASKAIVLNMAGKGIDMNTIADFTGLNMLVITVFLLCMND